jgi:glycosyltransferase involved in cell wall biosynthesis
MSQLNVVFDMSRLATRFSRPVPNGIDRVDLAYARHFTSLNGRNSAMLLGPLGPRVVQSAAAQRVIDVIETHWGEAGKPGDEPEYARLRTALLGRGICEVGGTKGAEWVHLGRSINRLTEARPLLGRSGLFPGRDPAKTLPRGAIYLNASQFPLWIGWYFRWLRLRTDIKPVFFIHDLLPIQYPEFFPAAEESRHRARMDVLASIGAGAIVASEETRTALAEHLARLGRPGMPIHVLPLPVSPVFEGPVAPDPTLATHPYFVVCGTIEPRKNHLLLLQIWRELASRLGPATPKLVIIGFRGWDNENVVDMLERCDALRAHVVETVRLSTPALRRVLANARALLMPTFAEGYGLPLIEAIAAGIPAIVSDIPSFTHCPHRCVTCLSPIDGLAWLRSVCDLLDSDRRGAPGSNAAGEASRWNWAQHLGQAEHFLTSL